MCIRDSTPGVRLESNASWCDSSNNLWFFGGANSSNINYNDCLLYTSDAADERSSVDLGGRRIIKNKTNVNIGYGHTNKTII